MTKRLPVSGLQNIFFDSQRVDDEDLTLEQEFNQTIYSGLVNNHLGTGVLLSDKSQKILFDSDEVVGYLDSVAIDFQAQPTDTNEGTQIELELTSSNVFGRRGIKVLIIGLDFNNELQYDRFTFYKNEKKVSRKHYTNLLKIYFNDFTGDPDISFNLGGRLVIRETASLTLSKDVIMIAQDEQPNLFLKDFYVTGGPWSLMNLLTTSLPNYNIDSLNLATGFKRQRKLLANDVSSQIGQKFIATTNNIQKITLLLGVEDTGSGLNWTGDIVVSIYPLQSKISCPTDITPDLAIDFPPDNIPIAQLSYNITTLEEKGYILSTVDQPIDFIFSNTSAATSLTVGNYYAVTIKRSGAANNCNITTSVGTDRTDDSRLTLFDGNVWTDVQEEDLWFQVWTDAAKVSDGKAYESGVGVAVSKIEQDNETGDNYDYSLDSLSFSRNDIFNALLRSTINESVTVQDERTGNPIFSRKEFGPTVTLFNNNQLNNLEIEEPFVLGTISDKNMKSFSLSTSDFNFGLTYFNTIKNKIYLRVITDNTSSYYDTDISVTLKEAVLNGSVLGAKIVPNTSLPSVFYKVANAEICTVRTGDLNNDGIVDEADLILFNELADFDFTSNPTLADYYSLIDPFTDELNTTFTTTIPTAGANGNITANILNDTLANFNATGNLTGAAVGDTITITTAANNQNIGTYEIVEIIDADNVTIKKKYIDHEIMLQIFAGDINQDFEFNNADRLLLEPYVDKSATFPIGSFPGNTIGTTFDVIVLTVEEFVDRDDEYPNTTLNRNANIHTIQDIFSSDPLFYGYSGFPTPIEVLISKKLTWHERNVIVKTNHKLVPCSFTEQTGFDDKCRPEDPMCQDKPDMDEFDPGLNDMFIPNNLLIKRGGNILNDEGNFHKIDFEIGIITLDMPVELFTEAKSVNIFTDFVAKQAGSDYTRLGYIPMKFADCSYVELNALENNQVRFSAAIQSTSHMVDGYADIGDGYYGIITDESLGVYLDHSTGILQLNFANLYEDPIDLTRSTRVEVKVYLKKSGFNNRNVSVSSDTMKNILGL